MQVGETILNLSVELAGVVICAAAILQVLLAKFTPEIRRNCLLFYGGLVLLLVANMAGMLMRGRIGPGWRGALYAANFVEFLMPTLLAYLVTTYLLSVVDPKGEHRALRRLLVAVLVLSAVGLTLSQFTGWYYVLDENNVYHRSAAYPVSYLAPALILGMDVYLALRHRDVLKRRERLAFWIFYLLPAASILLQLFRYGVNFTIFSIVLTGLAMYIFVVQGQSERYFRQERENARMRTEIMLSQIQPHFLYNSLGAIEALCDTDPKAAKQATAKFAQYLRGNVDALGQEGEVPFKTELRHTLLYLDLEKIRFEDALQINYDVTCTDFMLPTLTLQPIVENAVRHGVRGKADGRGRVLIATREHPDRWEVLVEDDGPGFDPAAVEDDGTHVGLRNVRERLETVCGGYLEIESSSNGTRVRILLPKKGEGKRC